MRAMRCFIERNREGERKGGDRVRTREGGSEREEGGRGEGGGRGRVSQMWIGFRVRKSVNIGRWCDYTLKPLNPKLSVACAYACVVYACVCGVCPCVCVSCARRWRTPHNENQDAMESSVLFFIFLIFMNNTTVRG